jgi:urease accessory protein
MPAREAALARLLQLSSPTLPVGAYTYSQGLEWAVESGTVADEPGARSWIAGLIESGPVTFEAAYVGRLMAAWTALDHALVLKLNEEFIASRETAELRAETLQMGYSLRRLLHELGEDPSDALAAIDVIDDLSYPAAWACAAATWQIEPQQALTAYIWSWLENQVMAAIKAVPLGQAAGQRILFELGGWLPAAVRQALQLPDEDLTNLSPALAIASSRHETQYSRLFRS